MRQYIGNENEVSDLLDDVVIEFTDSGKAFTAYDVSVEARKRTDVEFFHRDVAKYIHMTVRSIAPSYGVRQHATYQSREYFDKGVPTPALAFASPKLIPQPHPINPWPLAQSISKGIAKKSQAISTTAIPRSEGRVLIPATLIRYIGGTHQGRVSITNVKSGQLEIVQDSVTVVNPVAMYQVDHHNNVRLTKKTLALAGLDGKEVVLVAHTDKIVVTEKGK